MKKSLYTFIAFCSILTASCSEESPIEGLTTTKPSATVINAEIPVGSTKLVELRVNNQTLNLQIENYSTTSNGFESRDCKIFMHNNAGVFQLAPSSAYIHTAEAGTEISGAAFSIPSGGGTLYFVTRPVNSTSYNYVNTNGIRFGGSYYVPFKVVPGSGQSAPVYAYLQFAVAADKVVLNKMVYRTTGSLPAGGE